MLNKRLIYFLIVSVFATTGIFAQSQDPPSEEDLKRKIIKRELIDVAEGKWFYKVQYPELQMQGGLTNEGFRIASKKVAEQRIATFRKNMDSMTNDDWKNRPTKVDYEMSLGYEIELLNDDFISVSFSTYEYTGGAHGNYWSKTLNYDLKNKKVLSLSDLFKSNTNYLNVISKTSIEQITKKQGQYAAVDWIKKGASPTAKNFESWAITANGLKFLFDPYQVGPYAAGSFETIVPYSQFLPRMKSSLFFTAQMAGYIDGSPANWCRNGLFAQQTADFKIAYVKGSNDEKVHFKGDEKETCPDGVNCKMKSYVVPKDEVLIGRIYNNYACAWYQPSNGFETVGWLPINKLTIQGKKSPKYSWAGEWNFYENDIKFIPEKTVGDYVVTGNAFWKGVGDNVHVGDIGEESVRPKNGLVKFGGEDKLDCNVKMERVGKYLVVTDNKKCGGMNVTFDGVYTQKNNSQSSTIGETCSAYDFSELTFDNSARDINFRLGSIKTKKNKRAYFVDKAGLRKKSYLIQGNEVIVSKTNGKYGCAWYQPKKGKETVGWISLENLSFKPSSSIRQSWVGTWEYGEGEIKVIPQKRAGAYKFKAQTFWVGKGEGNVNIGDIEFVGTPTANRYSQNGTDNMEQCKVKMTLLGNYLVVSDNEQCGGRKVTFNGIYKKK